MTDARELAARLAAIKAVKDAAAEAEREVKAQLADLIDPGDRKAARIGGMDVGTVSFANPRPKARVVNEVEFADYVEREAPGEVTRPVQVDANDLLDAFDALLGDEHDLDPVVERLRAKAHAAAPVVTEAYRRKLLDAAASAGGLVDTTTGELLRCVVVETGPAYIATKLSDQHRANLAQLLARGDVELAGLLELPPGG